MAWETIHKTERTGWPAPCLEDYSTVCAGFSWEQARGALRGLPDGALNIAYEAVDRHLDDGLADKVAIRWLARDSSTGEQGVRDFSYRQLAALSSRFAHLLDRLGVAPGESVFSLLGRVPEVYVAALGTLKAGRVFSPLFSAFGPEPVKTRMEIGDARVLVTTEAFYLRKVGTWRHELPGLRHVLLTDRRGDELPEGTLSLADALEDCPDVGGLVATHPEDMALLHFTSGTTGRPKGAIHVHAAVLVHSVTGRYALDLHPEDTFWCTADPGWITGTSYGIVAPLAIGATMIVDEADLDPTRWFGILQDQRVTVWYTAPTAIRMLMKIGSEIARDYDLSPLRFLASVGEPLNPEAVVWGQDVLGLPFHDNWWQTETGGIMIANYRSMDVKPGSMGRPLPGIEAAIVRHHPQDPQVRSVEVIDSPNTPGELALKPGWPSMFRGYLNEPERYAKCFADGWYLTGDLAQRDPDGYFWFVGRADDMIKSAGHLIGPFEVESVLMEHEAVAEAAAIGIPEPTAGEIVKALVALKPGFAADEALRKSLLAHARKRLGPAVAPREIDFRTNLPKTRSGKIMRRLLKARELGLPEGDTSTLESDER